jgi:integrase
VTVWIRKRVHPATQTKPKPSTSWQVLYRRGGREWPIQTVGTYRSERDARTRRDLVAGWLAQGLNPKAELERMLAAPVVRRSFDATGRAMLATRHDIAASTVYTYGKALDKIMELRPDLAERSPDEWRVSDVQEAIGAMAADGMKPISIDRYLVVAKMVFDFADVYPNPARDRRVRVPAHVKAEVQPPSKQEFLALLRHVSPAAHRLHLIVLEQTAMRVGELVSLPWGDVDVAGARFRLSRERTKTRHPRWVQVPEWLMPHILDLCPLEDRLPERRVFSTTRAAIGNAMMRASRLSGVPVYSPHDLRHRRASLWHGQGVTVRDLMERGGWSRSTIAIDTYSHVMPLDEAPAAELESLLAVWSP